MNDDQILDVRPKGDRYVTEDRHHMTTADVTIHHESIARYRKLYAATGYWIAPDGTIYTIELFGHRKFAIAALGIEPTDEDNNGDYVAVDMLRNAGWLQISMNSVYMPPRGVTESQISALYNVYCELAPIDPLRPALLQAIKTRESVSEW